MTNYQEQFGSAASPDQQAPSSDQSSEKHVSLLFDERANPEQTKAVLEQVISEYQSLIESTKQQFPDNPNVVAMAREFVQEEIDQLTTKVDEFDFGDAYALAESVLSTMKALKQELLDPKMAEILSLNERLKQVFSGEETRI